MLNAADIVRLILSHFVQDGVESEAQIDERWAAHDLDEDGLMNAREFPAFLQSLVRPSEGEGSTDEPVLSPMELQVACHFGTRSFVPFDVYPCR